jgi:two-component SAPR family response regulator
VSVRIEVRAFGPGQVSCDGHVLSISAWRGSATARELLFYLLEHLPQRKEEIGVALWPNLSLARMTSAFHAAKYKARRALELEFVIYKDDRYQIDPSANIWYDVADFNRLLDSAFRRIPHDPDRLDELQQAVALYTADYLTQAYSDWALDRRQLLQRRYFDALSQLVDALLQQRHFDRVMALCRRGIELDFYREELHRNLMQCLAETGHPTEALFHYETMSRRLMHDLNAQPEPETTELANRIRLR